MELNEREKTIVDLINNLSEVASDETTTQESINRILESIKQKTAENVKAELAKAGEVSRPKVEFPDDEVSNSMKSAFASDHERMVGDLMAELKMRQSCQPAEIAPREPLLFTRIREVKAPCKAHPTDAGIDFFVPDKKAWDDDFKETVKKYSRNKIIEGLNGEKMDGVKFENGVLEVAPGAHVAIPSGIKTIIPQGLAMMMVNKSGVATKMKLDHSACLIDSEYRDELIFCFFNHNHIDSVKIEPGMKITQGLVVPVIDLKLSECLNCVYDDITKGSNRGGGFGSSGS